MVGWWGGDEGAWRRGGTGIDRLRGSWRRVLEAPGASRFRFGRRAGRLGHGRLAGGLAMKVVAAGGASRDWCRHRLLGGAGGNGVLRGRIVHRRTSWGAGRTKDWSGHEVQRGLPHHCASAVGHLGLGGNI